MSKEYKRNGGKVIATIRRWLCSCGTENKNTPFCYNCGRVKRK